MICIVCKMQTFSDHRKVKYQMIENGSLYVCNRLCICDSCHSKRNTFRLWKGNEKKRYYELLGAYQ